MVAGISNDDVASLVDSGVLSEVLIVAPSNALEIDVDESGVAAVCVITEFSIELVSSSGDVSVTPTEAVITLSSVAVAVESAVPAAPSIVVVDAMTPGLSLAVDVDVVTSGEAALSDREAPA